MPTQQSLLQLYASLPRELKDALFSEEVSENIFKVCEKTDTLDKVSVISSIVSKVLTGTLKLEDFEIELKIEANLDSKTAREIASEINLFIFSPLKESLVLLSSKEYIPSPYNTDKLPEKTEPIETMEEKIEPVNETEDLKDIPSFGRNYEETKGPDTYREPIE